MLQTVLEEVRQAESEAEKLIVEAGRKKETIIAEARARAAQFLKEKEEELAKKKANVIGLEKEDILAARQKVLGQGGDRLKSLRKSAEKKLEDAVELALEAFDKEISQL